MSRTAFFFFTLILLFAFPATVSAQDTGRKPNIVFIMADDLGWRDLACFGSKFHHTPNFDKLAAAISRRFTATADDSENIRQPP